MESNLDEMIFGSSLRLEISFHTDLIGLIKGADIIDCDEQEVRLLKYLMEGYDAAVRPASHFAQPLSVNFSLSLHHIIDVVGTPSLRILSLSYISLFSSMTTQFMSF